MDKGISCYTLYYQKTKKTIFFQSRDFYDKSFKFYDDGAFYRYSCTVPDSETLLPPDSNVTRGETLFNFHKVFRDPKTHEVKVIFLAQCDAKITLPGFIKNTFMPKTFEGWLSELLKFYKEKHSIL